MLTTIRYANIPLAALTSIEVRGKPAVGGAQLVVELHMIMQPNPSPKQGTKRPPRLIGIRGEVAALGALIAPLQPVAVDLQCPPHGYPAQPNSHPVQVHALLAPAQVRALDLMRDKTGGLMLRIGFTFEAVGGPAGLMGLVLAENKYVSSSDWTKILREMEFEDRATFEVPIEGGRVGPPLDQAAAHMREALNQLQKHDWSDALVKCRMVLDELAQRQRAKTPPWAEWDDKIKREGWALPERVVAMQAAVRHLMHPGAHGSATPTSTKCGWRSG